MSLDEQKLEQISAGIDGERGESSSSTGVDGHDSKAVWSRYHLIGDLLSQNVPPGGPVDVCSKVAGALEREPVVLAPGRARKSNRISALSERVVGVAIAASVALVVVFGVQRFQSVTGSGGGLAAQRVQADRASQIATSGAATSWTRFPFGTWRGQGAGPAVEQRLNGYLIDHSDQTSGVGVQAMVPSVQVVGYDD